MFEEVMTQGESVAVPGKGVEGKRSAFPDAGISGCWSDFQVVENS